jgi:hypothetical protein
MKILCEFSVFEYLFSIFVYILEELHDWMHNDSNYYHRIFQTTRFQL